MASLVDLSTGVAVGLGVGVGVGVGVGWGVKVGVGAISRIRPYGLHCESTTACHSWARRS